MRGVGRKRGSSRKDPVSVWTKESRGKMCLFISKSVLFQAVLKGTSGQGDGSVQTSRHLSLVSLVKTSLNSMY